jgi:hypothetical protein
MSREQLMRMQASARVYQERADNALAPWDLRAPAPVLGQDIDSYRRDLDVRLKKQLPEDHRLRQVQYRGLKNDALDVLEPQLYKAVKDGAYDVSTVPRGELRKVVEIGQDGMKIVKFIGSQSFVLDPSYGHRPGRRVKSFLFDRSALRG